MDIKALRQSLGLNQSDFASRLGLSSKSHVSELENGGSCSVRVALKVEELSGGQINAASLHPDIALVRSGSEQAA